MILRASKYPAWNFNVYLKNTLKIGKSLKLSKNCIFLKEITWRQIFLN